MMPVSKAFEFEIRLTNKESDESDEDINESCPETIKLTVNAISHIQSSTIFSAPPPIYLIIKLQTFSLVLIKRSVH